MVKKRRIETKRIKRGYDIEEDVLAEFESWTTENGYLKNSAVQLAIWVLQRLDPQTRQQCNELMNLRAGGEDLRFTLIEESAAEMEQARAAILKHVRAQAGPAARRKSGA